jgi:2-dehydro-3-deoxygalactonokinase
VDGQRADVIRGEEVQLFGAVTRGLIPPDCLVCHPGTHNKWVRLDSGRATSFRTVMTGEMFSLLKEKSILSDWLHNDVEAAEAFRSGTRRGLAGGTLTAELFSVRAGVLLGKLPPGEAASFTSGLLIGADVRTGLIDMDGGEIIVMGRPELTRLYAVAIEEAGHPAREVDGEPAFLAGIHEIVRKIQ